MPKSDKVMTLCRAPPAILRFLPQPPDLVLFSITLTVIRMFACLLVYSLPPPKHELQGSRDHFVD